VLKQTFHSVCIIAYRMYMILKVKAKTVEIIYLVGILNISGTAAAFGSSRCDDDD
jgi:hypothetical protein